MDSAVHRSPSSTIVSLSPRRARRRASASLFQSPPRPNAPPPPAPEPPELPKSDLRTLTELCTDSVTRCSALEREVDALRHSIDTKLQQWDTLLDTLRSSSTSSATLTTQLRQTLSTLRTSTTSQLSQSREAVSKASERVEVSRETLEKASATIKNSESAIEHLEKRLREEESMLEKIDSATQLMLWLSFVVVLMLAMGVGWWRLSSSPVAVTVAVVEDLLPALSEMEGV